MRVLFNVIISTIALSARVGVASEYKDMQFINCQQNDMAAYQGKGRSNGLELTGAAAAIFGAGYGINQLVLPSELEIKIRSNRQLVAELRSFARLDIEHVRINAEFKAVGDLIHRFIELHGLSERLTQLREANRLKGINRSPSPEQLFEGTTVTESDRRIFAQLQTQRDLILKKQEINSRQWAYFYNSIEHLTNVRFNHLARIELKPEQLAQLKTNAERASKIADIREARIAEMGRSAYRAKTSRFVNGLAGVGISVLGASLFAYADELAGTLDEVETERLAAAHENIVAKSLSCLGQYLDQTEEPMVDVSLTRTGGR
jgi:hypothetical protein